MLQQCFITITRASFALLLHVCTCTCVGKHRNHAPTPGCVHMAQHITNPPGTDTSGWLSVKACTFLNQRGRLVWNRVNIFETGFRLSMYASAEVYGFQLSFSSLNLCPSSLPYCLFCEFPDARTSVLNVSNLETV